MIRTCIVCINNISSIADDFNISPDEIVAPIGDSAEISCLYKPAPIRLLQWGVVRNGVPFIIIPDNTTNNIKVSLDKRTLIFDPVIQSQEGNYYCWLPLTITRNVYSRIVPFTILRKSIIHIHVFNNTLYTYLNQVHQLLLM